jgi:hypothetical protein
MRVNLLALESEKKFEEFCQALLKEEFQRFQAFSAPDLGMDGYDSDSETIFQVYFPEQAPRRDKICSDLDKAKGNSWACKRWVLLLPKNPTPQFLQWFYRDQQPSFPFKLEVWGKTEILALLLKHLGVKEAYFPSELREELRRLGKGKRPGTGDANPGEEISPEEAAALHQLITELVEEEATRKRRKPRPADFGREYGEFNAYFHLSSYDRLPSSGFLEARRYLEKKQYGRRRSDRQEVERHRYISGIKAIQSKLKIRDQQYRGILLEITGKSSTTQMDIEELDRVFKRFRYLQGLAETRP